MTAVLFCDACFCEIRDISPILLMVWTSIGLIFVNVGRPISNDEFENMMFEWNGLREPQISRSLKKLEKMGFLVTHEVEGFTLIRPAGVFKSKTGVINVCPKNHFYDER